MAASSSAWPTRDATRPACARGRAAGARPGRAAAPCMHVEGAGVGTRLPHGLPPRTVRVGGGRQVLREAED
eukprot:4808134-Prymnesium_polylepis.1